MTNQKIWVSASHMDDLRIANLRMSLHLFMDHTFTITKIDEHIGRHTELCYFECLRFKNCWRLENGRFCII